MTQTSGQKRDKLPFVAIGNEELAEPLGDYEKCPKCGKPCEVEYSDEKTLAFVRCCGLWLVGVDGKRWHR